MTAISGTRRQMKEMADGTIRVMIDIDPIHRRSFLEIFPAIDMPVALAPLVADFEHLQKEEEPAKGGALAKLAGMLCKNPEFIDFFNLDDEAEAENTVRIVCGIKSRAELDHNIDAASTFHREFRIPFAERKA